MPIEIAIPFALSSDGSIAVETNPDRQISQRVRALVGTQPGERLFRPEVGVPLLRYVFDPDDDLIESQMASDVSRVMARYEPGVVVQKVTPVSGMTGDGIASIEVDYQRTDSPSSSTVASKQVNTAVIQVGGTVSEIVRG